MLDVGRLGYAFTMNNTLLALGERFFGPVLGCRFQGTGCLRLFQPPAAAGVTFSSGDPISLL